MKGSCFTFRGGADVGGVLSSDEGFFHGVLGWF